MSFNYANATKEASMPFGQAIVTRNFNWFKVPAVVDVSAMEFWAATVTTEAASSASVVVLTVVDGSATGDAVATTATLIGQITNSPSTGTAWTANTPRTGTASTSASDLDADDYVNVVITNGATASGLTFGVAYIHGKPAAIN